MAPTPAPPKMNQKDHYATLEINRDATAKGIKDAYRKLALKCHPDHGGSNAAMQNVRSSSMNKGFQIDTDGSLGHCSVRRVE